MKNKKLLMVLMFIISSIMISCSNKISNEDMVIDSVIIDEDAKGTANSNNVISITKIATTENLIPEKKAAIIRQDEKLINFEYSEDFGEGEGTIYQSQFPKLYISSLSIGTITDEIQNNRNVVTWENKNFEGQLLIDYMGSAENLKVFKDNRVYMIDNNYNLKEITAYMKLTEETNGDINRFEQSYDDNLDIYYMDNNNNKLWIIDTVNDKYYEINRKEIGNIENKRLNIIMAQDDKIYVSIVDTANEEVSILGYIENDKLTTFFDEKSSIKVRVTGDVLYSNNNILFSGYVEDNYGIWNYNIESKQLEKQLELKYDYSYFKISKDKNFIIITNMNTDSIENYSINLARIDGNFKISNIQELTNSILPNRSSNNGISITAWSNNENKFYVSYVKTKKVDSGEKIDDVYYEIYEVK